jgi:competence protein ComEA
MFVKISTFLMLASLVLSGAQSQNSGQEPSVTKEKSSADKKAVKEKALTDKAAKKETATKKKVTKEEKVMETSGLTDKKPVNATKPKVVKEEKPSAPSKTVRPSTGAININNATAQQLEILHGIGPVKAQAIVDYRKKHGAFKNVNDVVNVPGIGDATYNSIKSDIKIR